MLRSGLFFAGVNTWRKGRQVPEEVGKGFLFAQDVAALDLWANELTVLCACQTAVGEVRIGEGVFGLRRAFAVAGAKAVVMSLWSVPAYASALLVQHFFANIQQGLEARKALQEAQNDIRAITIAQLRQSVLGRKALGELTGLKNGEELPSETQLDCEESTTPFVHPYFWGAWIYQGKTSTIQ